MCKEEEENETDFEVLKYMNKLYCTDEKFNMLSRILERNPKVSKRSNLKIIHSIFRDYIYDTKKGLKNIEQILDKYEVTDKKEMLSKLIDTSFLLRKRLYNKINEVQNLCETKLIVFNKDNTESYCFFSLIKADFSRYHLELLSEGSDKEEAKKKCKHCYQSSYELAKTYLKQYDPLYLSIVVNFTLFLFQHMNEKKAAYDIAQKTLDDFNLETSESISDEDKNTIEELRNVLLNNLNQWPIPEKNL